MSLRLNHQLSYNRTDTPSSFPLASADCILSLYRLYDVFMCRIINPLSVANGDKASARDTSSTASYYGQFFRVIVPVYA